MTQSPRWEVGVGFVGALAVGFAVLAGLAKGIAWAARRVVPAGAPYVVRQGVANLHRPNNRTVLLLLALGLGTFLIVTLTLTRATLLAQIAGSGGEGRPNLLFFDIQDDQIAELEVILAREQVRLEASAPIVTMRGGGLEGAIGRGRVARSGQRGAGVDIAAGVSLDLSRGVGGFGEVAGR